MAELELVGITKIYDGHRVVDDVSLKLPSGAFLTLLGPSGCGKSTTLRIIAGLTAASAGVVRIGARDVTGVRPAARNIGMVFQSLALFPHMTVEENIGFSLRVQRMPAAERNKRVAEALELVRMRTFAGRYPSQISGGQRQRVALARAIVFNPDILLLDEPFSALDRKLREEMQQELRRLAHRLGVTTVFVTHDQEEAIRLSDRVAVMREGRIDQVDTPEAVYNRPATRFVADFMGAANDLEARVVSASASSAVLEAAGSTFTVPVTGKEPLSVGARIWLNVRPERLKLSAHAPSGKAALRGRITSRVFEGAFTVYEVKLDGAEAPWVVREALGQASFAAQSEIGEGEVWVGWNAEDAQAIAD